jgi:hypothetical protein
MTVSLQVQCIGECFGKVRLLRFSSELRLTFAVAVQQDRVLVDVDFMNTEVFGMASKTVIAFPPSPARLYSIQYRMAARS